MLITTNRDCITPLLNKMRNSLKPKDTKNILYAGQMRTLTPLHFDFGLRGRVNVTWWSTERYSYLCKWTI